MHYHADRGMQGDGDRVRNRMVGMDKFCLKGTQLNRIAGLNAHQLGFGKQVMLLQLTLHQSQGQTCSVNRDVNFFQEVRNPTNMILVTVG